MRWKFSKAGLVIFLILMSMLILHYSGILVPVENLALRVLSPMSGGFYSLGQKIESWRKPQISQDDYTKLETERNQLLAENVELKLLGKENEELKKALNFSIEKKKNFLIANVVGRDSASSNYFVLNKGKNDGIKENYPVISPEGVLVGKIVKAEAKASLFLIPTDTNFQTAATVLGKSKRSTSGLVRGEKGLGISMEFIPQDELIEKDDIVVTSGIELDMPKGLIIGRVTEVQKEARDIFGRATINPALSYNNLIIVMIVIPETEIK
jgi:rod shape-determining protein MreC